jgi:hypothetical protein
VLIAQLRSLTILTLLTACDAGATGEEDPPLDEIAAVGATYQVGSFAGRSFFRTSDETRTISVTCRSASVSQAAYDPLYHKTYVVYAGGIGGPTGIPGVDYSAANPTIIAFDHTARRWSAPVQLLDVRSMPGATGDCHNYPQVLVDAGGTIHVFHTTHNTGQNIQYFRSASPGSITSWRRSELRSPTASPPWNTVHNTYGAAFRDNQGELYVFYRASFYAVYPLFYEAQMFTKSSDGGTTWTRPRLLIDPGRPRQSDGTEAAAVTSLINDTGWSTIYVGDYAQDRANNRLALEFGSGYHHSDKFGNRYFAFFDLTTDRVLSPGRADLGPTLTRTQYAAGCCTLYAPPHGALSRALMDANYHAFSHAIVFEDPATGNPSVYYTLFESSNPAAGVDNPAYYQVGWDRLKKARWTGSAWATSYASGVADPTRDPLVQPDLAGVRRGVLAIWDAERRDDGSTDLYLKTRWRGTAFWLDASGQLKPEYRDPPYPAALRYQFPTYIVNTRNYAVGMRLFADHPDWEVRGLSNLNLVPGAHPAIRAFAKVPKYSGAAYSPGPDFARSYAIGADYVFGEAAP